MVYAWGFIWMTRASFCEYDQTEELVSCRKPNSVHSAKDDKAWFPSLISLPGHRYQNSAPQHSLAARRKGRAQFCLQRGSSGFRNLPRDSIRALSQFRSGCHRDRHLCHTRTRTCLVPYNDYETNTIIPISRVEKLRPGEVTSLDKTV